MKNLFNLSLTLCIVISLFSCKKDNDLMPVSATGTTVIQSAPGTAARSIPGEQLALGDMGDYVILGIQHTDVSLAEDMIANGKVGVGPAGKLKFDDRATVNGNIYLHNGVQSEMHGTLNGTLYQPHNLAGLNGDFNQVSHNAEILAPTVTLYDVTTSVTILGNGGINVINMHKMKLDNAEEFILSGNPNELFVINIEEDFELSGTAKIITANGASSSHVLINLLGKDKKGTSKNSNIINGTILAADREVELGNVNGQILSGGKKLKVRKDAVINYIRFTN